MVCSPECWGCFNATGCTLVAAVIGEGTIAAPWRQATLTHGSKPFDLPALKDANSFLSSIAWGKVLPHEVSHWISRQQTPTRVQLLSALVFYLVDDGTHASREFVLAPRYRAGCTLHPAEDCCSSNGKRKGEWDELRARSAPMPKHTLQIFLLQWDT